ncbi:hypothetical protein AC578_359 [Pseudocercospora eumusae]|uniref:Ribonucleases P/MRP subunit Pop8-like domain-containing protein n=1 Tax=Pseudocercospora eumusae TaxID=321146 RepID=A0A139HU33_9PEZI|nr:hypothetical protein AC578_359 [Pseudocercospora eumusae]
MDPEVLPDATTQQPSSKTSKNQILSEFSIRNPHWVYIRLQHLSAPTRPKQALLDGVTAKLHITAALSSFLGLHGTAIAIDVLKLEDQDVWIRVPAEDRAAVIAAVGGWTNSSRDDGWRVKGWSHWSATACGQRDSGQDLFD